MRCTSPRTVGFKADGKTLAWSPKSRSLEYAVFQLPCSKCIECRLDYARQWAVRCVHEAQMYDNNCFLTFTYSDEHLGDNRLDYSDFQKLMKKLRKLQDAPMGFFVTGEYGELTKRKHWHAIIFNWSPPDKKEDGQNHRGDKIYTSEMLTKIWGKGHCNSGSVTFDSAAYVARYAAKKLIHGKDGEHDYNPISKKSSKHAIGKKWLEQFWPDVFSRGSVVLRDGSEIGIPRYYEKWFHDNHPEKWIRYVTEVKFEKSEIARERAEALKQDWLTRLYAKPYRYPLTPDQVRQKITEDKFQKLQAHLKL